MDDRYEREAVACFSLAMLPLVLCLLWLLAALIGAAFLLTVLFVVAFAHD